MALRGKVTNTKRLYCFYYSFPTPLVSCSGHTRYRHDQTQEFRDMPGAQVDQSHLCKQGCWLCPPEGLRGQRRQLVEEEHGKHWCRNCTQGLAVVQEFAVFLPSSGTEGRWLAGWFAEPVWPELKWSCKWPCSSSVCFSVSRQNYLYLLYLRAVWLTSTRGFSHCMQFFPVFLLNFQPMISSTTTNTTSLKNILEARKNNPAAQKQEPWQPKGSLGLRYLFSWGWLQ